MGLVACGFGTWGWIPASPPAFAKGDVHQPGLLTTQGLGFLPGLISGAAALWVLLESRRGCDCTRGWASAFVWGLKACFFKKSRNCIHEIRLKPWVLTAVVSLAHPQG